MERTPGKTVECTVPSRPGWVLGRVKPRHTWSVLLMCVAVCAKGLGAQAGTNSFAPALAVSIEGQPYAIAAIYQPASSSSYPVPAVLLLHGTASQKNEVGNLYGKLASALAAAGIASLRMDFAGSGDSPVGYRRYTLSSATDDARRAIAYLRSQPHVHGQQIAVVGFSQGGLIAQRLVLADRNIAALATWSTVAGDGVGSFADFFSRHYATARSSGYAEVMFPWLDEPLAFDLQWFEEIKKETSFSQMRGYARPILAIAGTRDSTVPYSQSVSLVAQSTHPQSRAVLIAGADHIFNTLGDASGPATQRQDQQLLDLTVDWLKEVLR